MDELYNDQHLADFLRSTASAEPTQRSTALTQFLGTLGPVIRQGAMDGDNVAGIFSMVTLPPGVSPEFPVDFITPGSEGEFRAFTNPGKGKPPALVVSGDKITLADKGNILRVEYDLQYARNARWDVVGRLVEAHMAGFVKTRNDDCWHTILASVADRGVVVYDSAATQGVFTKKLFSLARCSMARNSGGNASSIKKGRLTDVYLSCEGIEEILNWNLDQVPESVRSQLYSMSGGDNTTLDILKVRLHEMYELGTNQEYQSYYLNRLGGQLATSDDELAIGLDLVNRDSFIFAVTQPLEVFEDPALHASQKGGFYGWERYAVGALDSRRNFAMSY